MRRFIILLAVFYCPLSVLNAQEIFRFETTVHDFGQVLLSDGPVSCSFKAVNVSSSPAVIQSVISSCGCTSVKWDHKPIAPGKSIEVTATYSNDEGPYPFDKTLTVSIVGTNRPVILHLRGTAMERLKSDAEIYTFKYGDALALSSDSFKCVNIEQGESRGDQTTVANLSDKELKVTFDGVSEGLKMEVRPNPIPAGGHATLYYTVSSIPGKWGRNLYKATPVVNGKSTGRSITVTAHTTENFSSLTREQKSKGSRPVFAESTWSFGHKKQGAKVSATFKCVNKGAAPLHIYKVDSDYEGLSAAVPVKDVAPGAEGTLTVSLDTKNLPKGEALVIVSLTTNSPQRPIVNLFFAGIID